MMSSDKAVGLAQKSDVAIVACVLRTARSRPSVTLGLQVRHASSWALTSHGRSGLKQIRDPSMSQKTQAFWLFRWDSEPLMPPDAHHMADVQFPRRLTAQTNVRRIAV